MCMSSQIFETKLIGLQGKIDESSIILGNFNILLSEMDRYTRQKIQGPSWTQQHHQSSEYKWHL